MAVAIKIPDVVWERHETEIRSFLPPQSKKPMKLRDLMKHMDEKHGLQASIPQWKVRLDKWGLTKKRGLKRKACALDSNDSLTTRHETPSHHEEQPRSKVYFTDSEWTSRFVTANFESQLYYNMFNPAQALFDHIQLPRRGLSSLSLYTQTVTEALFLLQSLNGIMQEADENHFKAFARHLDILRVNASMIIEQDYPMFLRIAAFFLQINRITNNSRPEVLPIVIGCLHKVCENRFGYAHQVTMMIRSLSLSAIFEGKPVRDVSPREWEALRTVQVTALICWLKEYDETCPLGRRRLRVLYGLNNLLGICGMPELGLKISSWNRLIGNEPKPSSSNAANYETLLKVLDQMGAPRWITSSWSPRLHSVLRTSKLVYTDTTFGQRSVTQGRKLWSATLNHSKDKINKHVSQRFFFVLDESIDGIISGQICDLNISRFVEARTLSKSDRYLNEPYLFQVSLNEIIQPNSVFHAGAWDARTSPRTHVSERSICTRLWFSLAEYISGWKSKAPDESEGFGQFECCSIWSGNIHDGKAYVNFTCRGICMHNLHDFWPILFHFMRTSSSQAMNSIPRILDVCLRTSVSTYKYTSCSLDRTATQPESLMPAQTQILFEQGREEVRLVKCHDGIMLYS